VSKRNKDKTVSIGWAGRFADGTIGWCVSPFVQSKSEKLSNINLVYKGIASGEKFVRVKITVEVVRDGKGREIVRRMKAGNK